MSLKKSTLTLGAMIMMSVPISAGAQNIDYMDIKNRQGQVTYSLPLPTDWQFISNPNSDHYIRGPNGIKLYHPTDNAYYYGQNMGGQTLGGRQFLAPMSAQQYFQQMVAPYLQSQGYQLIDSYPIPEYVAMMENYSAGMPNTGNRRYYYAIGSDWQSGPQKKSMVTTVMTFVESQHGTAWNASMAVMDAPHSQFEMAKKTVRYGVKNVRLGRDLQMRRGQELIAFNRDLAERDAIRDRNEEIRHQREMSDIAARGAESRAIGRAGSDALDSSMDSYRRIQAMKDGGQERSVRGIRGETIISGPNSNETFTVPSGSDYYWVNQNGEYIPTDNSLYNPNTDNAVNNDQWTLSNRKD